MKKENGYKLNFSVHHLPTFNIFKSILSVSAHNKNLVGSIFFLQLAILLVQKSLIFVRMKETIFVSIIIFYP